MIRGRLSGIVMGAESATVGSNAGVLVRGRRSINSTSTSPLLVVNGVIFTGCRLEDIDQTSIESIESVLKDATSLAAYGSKAANGVIIVTLKRRSGRQADDQLSTSPQFSTPSYRQKFTLSGELHQIPQRPYRCFRLRPTPPGCPSSRKPITRPARGLYGQVWP